VRSAQSNLQVLWEQLDTARIADAGSPQQAVELRGEFEGSHIECVDGSAGYAGTQGEKRRSLNLLAVVVALVLLIACANVACLLLARGVARQQEISIRLSLGAGGRIVRQLMLESWFLALAGGAAGLLLAVWAERLLLIMFQWENRPIALSPDWRMLAFSFAASVATGVLFGMFPALQTQRVRLSLVGLKA
jgi:ABC-type antimicrobial peptide transport system permease subunit